MRALAENRDRAAPPREMLEPDGAEAQRKADQIGKAQLRAGVVVPSGCGVLGGDPIGIDLDALDLFGGDALVAQSAISASTAGWMWRQQA